MIDRVKDFGWIKSLGLWKTSDEEREKHIKKMAENRQKCSCHMCRNPRRSDFYSGEEKLTMQERRASRPEDDDVQL